MLRRALTIALVLAVAAVRAETGSEIIAEAARRNGFATWHDRTSVVVLEGFEDDVRRMMREARVYERTDPRGPHDTLMEILSPDDVRGTRYLHVSPQTRTRSVVTVKEVAYDTGLGDDVFAIAHLGESAN